MPPDRAYEVVGLTVLSPPPWDASDGQTQPNGLLPGRRIPPRLAAINESSTTTTVPSDYV